VIRRALISAAMGHCKEAGAWVAAVSGTTAFTA
jgi:hypothetical protein